jgi:hypothetical protein
LYLSVLSVWVNSSAVPFSDCPQKAAVAGSSPELMFFPPSEKEAAQCIAAPFRPLIAEVCFSMMKFVIICLSSL